MTESAFALRRGVFPSVLTDPHADERSQPFWDAAREGRLIAPRCTSCGTVQMPPAPVCWECQGRDAEWIELPGTGSVYSFTVVRHPLHPDLSQVVPYVIAVVELDGTQGAGARMIANLTDCDPEEVTVGMAVRIWFDPVNDEMTTPRFRPALD